MSGGDVESSGTTSEIAAWIQRSDLDGVKALGPGRFSAQLVGQALARFGPALKARGITATKKHTDRGTVWAFSRRRDPVFEPLISPSEPEEVAVVSE